jgi:BMFP domain-containing protein YqiC
MVSRDVVLARIAALEARAHPIRKADQMATAADLLAVVIDFDDHRRRTTLEDAERRVAALEARIGPIVQRGARRP